MTHKKQLTTKDILLGVAAVAAVAALVFFGSRDDTGVIPQQSVEVKKEVPAMTTFMRQVLEKSNGFQFLVSYTDGGFEPATATIKVGDTVRFTNNSSGPLWIAAAGVDGGAVYPSIARECGQSSFDTCIEMQPQEFWEFTFEQKGTWGYKNFPGGEHTGIIKAE